MTALPHTDDSAPRFPLPEAFVRAMGRIHGKRILFLSSPAGFGKTTFARQWLEEAAIPAHWITLDAYDNAVTRMCDDLITLLMKFQPDNTALISTALASSDNPLDKLLSSVMRLREPRSACAFVIDDLHIIEDEVCRIILPRFIQRLPEGIFVFLLSCAPPNPMLAEWSVRDMMPVIGTDDMRLNARDVCALWRHCGLSLDEERAKEIAEATFGWLLAVYALLNAETGEARIDTAESYRGFLDSNIWTLWNKEEQEFLLRVSFLETLPPDLCNRLTGHQNSEHLLRRLQGGSAFIHPAGDGEWRISEVIRRYLLEKSYAALSPSTLRSLYHIAAIWYFKKKEYLAATDCYVLERDRAGIVSTISTMSDREIENSVEHLHLYAHNHVARLPKGYIDDKPELLAHNAWYQYLDGNAQGFCASVDAMLALEKTMNADDLPFSFRDITFFVPILDFRQSIMEIAQSRKGVLFSSNERKGPPHINSVTQNFPYAHRSMRDFSDLADMRESSFDLIRSSIGKMIGEEYNVLELCLRAGLSYEKGSHSSAYRYALSAYECLDERHAAEYRFSVLMILHQILRAMHRESHANSILDEAERLVSGEKASHLRMNFEACRLRATKTISPQAAEAWLSEYGTADDEKMLFMRMPRHFATISSLIVINNPQQALRHCLKLKKLVSDYKRPLDSIEVSIFMAVSHWRAGEKKMAADALIAAYTLAQKYRYVQLFAEHSHFIQPIHDYMEAIEGNSLIEPLFLAEVMGIVLRNTDLWQNA